MWICVRCIEREMEIVAQEDKREDIEDAMYNDMCDKVDGEGELTTLIVDGNAEFCNSDENGWTNYKGQHFDWKCFWI